MDILLLIVLILSLETEINQPWQSAFLRFNKLSNCPIVLLNIDDIIWYNLRVTWNFSFLPTYWKNYSWSILGSRKHHCMFLQRNEFDYFFLYNLYLSKIRQVWIEKWNIFLNNIYNMKIIKIILIIPIKTI